MIHHLQIEIGDFRILDALVDINSKWYGESEFASGHSDYSWKCLELTETLEDGTIVHLEVDDYENEIEQMVIAEI